MIIVTTTVDQATQCHKRESPPWSHAAGCSLTGLVVRNVGGPLGVRSALAAGAAGSSGLQNEIAAMHRDAIHLLVGTPAKLNEILNTRGSVSGGECRLLIVRICGAAVLVVSLMYHSWTRWISSSCVKDHQSCEVTRSADRRRRAICTKTYLASHDSSPLPDEVAAPAR